MKIEIVCLHGFYEGKGGAALTIRGDENSVTLTKGPMLDGWLADSSKIIVDEGETTVSAENYRRLAIMLGQWLRGEEVDI